MQNRKGRIWKIDVCVVLSTALHSDLSSVFRKLFDRQRIVLL
jgi:hypothetical protein